MKKFFTLCCFTIVLLTLLNTYVKAQVCSNPLRFSEVPLFSISEIDSAIDVVYGNAINAQNQPEDLLLDFYYPKMTIDTLALRPVIIFIHGGGFVGGKKENFTVDVREFAKRGFVSATINYRLGHNCQQDTLSYDKAVYRALQDANAAFRYMVSQAAQLRIDTNWLFVGGGSAGAVTSLGLVYLSQAEWNAYNPTVVSQLGNLNNSGNTLTNKFSIKAVYNNWGAIAKDFMQVNEMVPMIAFHGDEDTVVPIDSSFGSNTACPNALKVYGSRSLYQTLLQNNICSELTVKVGGGHGIYNNSVSRRTFRTSRAACFFKSVMCNSCNNFYTEDSIAPLCSTIVTNIKSDENNNAALLFPNPSSHFIYFSNSESIQNIYVHSVDGKQIDNLPLVNNGIDISALPNGLYFIMLITEKEKIYKRFIKFVQP